MTTRWELEASVEERLEAAGVPSPEVDARLLLDAVEERFGDPTRCETAVLDGMVERRIARVPLQVILGRTTFRWVDLEVEAGVFVPRPETEVVAGLAIAALHGVESPIVVEPCTGTGAITCALLSEVPGVKVLATDLSADAVALARRNVARTLAGEATSPRWTPRGGADAEVLHGSLLDPLAQLGPGIYGAVDVLVSNPPYLPSGDLASMEPEVAHHDPHAALFGGEDGHELVALLLERGLEWLAPGGTIVIEIDDRRGPETVTLAREAGFVDARVAQDLTGRDRVLVARRAS